MFNDFFHSLSDKEINIFNFISSNIISVCEMNIKELSLKLNVTEYSINKFCKKINVDNFENLTSILKELLKSSSNSSNYIFENSIKTFSDFISKINESQITEICKLILKHKSISILFSDSSKQIANYLNQNLNSLNIDTYELTRILGILLDNSIEAAQECEKKYISVRFIMDHRKNRQLVIVENTYKDKTIDTYKIFEKSYSTKPHNTGLGLWEVNKILKKY